MKTIKEFVEEIIDSFDIKTSEELFNTYKKEDMLRFISGVKKSQLASSLIGDIFEKNREDVIWYFISTLAGFKYAKMKEEALKEALKESQHETSE